MSFWPFHRSEPEPLTAIELREKLIETARTGSRRQLRRLCRQYKRQVAEHVETIRTAPEDLTLDDATADQYFQLLATAAECLARDCDAPELWSALYGSPEDNPFVQWDNWYGEFPDRMESLEYEALITEAENFLERARTLRGQSARQNESFLSGRLGQLLFHSGQVSAAIPVFQSTLDLCAQLSDLEGQDVYLNCLLEAHCYLDNGQAVEIAEQQLAFRQRHGGPTGDLASRVQRLRIGEPLCRVVGARDGQEFELDEIASVGDGHYKFLFRRNRLALQKSLTLTRQGNQLASQGQHSDALEKYQQASDVDPFNPDPVYQSGECFLEMGLYVAAREAFDEVERLAPGWFRCRFDRWLAEALEQGAVSEEEFRVHRMLEDGGLEPAQTEDLARQAIDRFPEFAPLHEIKGHMCRNRGDDENAIAAYREGLRHVHEPDLESRLLCALAGILPKESPERMDMLQQVIEMEGSLVATAMARLIQLQK